MPTTLASAVLLLAACGAAGSSAPHDPAAAPVAPVDRFSAAAATLMVRTSSNGLPAGNAPIDCDQGPFITQGLGPSGQVVQYYNFDVRPLAPAPIYAFFESGATAPVSGQLNVIDVLPGQPGYNDFWQVMKVTVPSGYIANTIGSLGELQDAGYAIAPTAAIVNCPVVPAGSTASKRLDGGTPGLMQGWYRDEVVSYFSFEEAPLTVAGGQVPVSPIYVTFNVNPPDGGPATGFETESGSSQTHNVVGTLPGEGGYSPLWSVVVYDDSDFDSVSDLSSAQAASTIGPGPLVNCPIVSVQ